MASSSFFTNSPTVLMQPQQSPDQYFSSAHYQPVQSNSSVQTPYEAFSALTTNSVPPTPSSGAVAGRKRSREDIFEHDEESADGSSAPSQEPQAPVVPRGEPIYGPGMTIIYPNDPSGHYAMDAGSQSGTWVEQRSEETVTQSSPKRPIMASRKSQRLDSTASAPDDIMLSMPEPLPRAPGSEPFIDEASRALGISWTRMDATEPLQIAKRAYTRWITRHYPFLQNVEIWFENSAIPGYLGVAQNTTNGMQEYYLWSQDLHQAILVTRNPADLVVKLSQPHMSLSQATDRIKADVEPVVEAAAANAAIVLNDRVMNGQQDAMDADMVID